MSRLLSLVFGQMMTRDRSFLFVDERLQDKLLVLVRAIGVPHGVNADKTLLYASADEQVIENELICSIRDRIFLEWTVFTLEGDEVRRPQTTGRYREYMKHHGIPFAEEVVDGFVWFLVPQDQDSFAWAVPQDDEAEPGAAADRPRD